jgi:hypothetical protein
MKTYMAGVACWVKLVCPTYHKESSVFQQCMAAAKQVSGRARDFFRFETVQRGIDNFEDARVVSAARYVFVWSVSVPRKYRISAPDAASGERSRAAWMATAPRSPDTTVLPASRQLPSNAAAAAIFAGDSTGASSEGSSGAAAFSQKWAGISTGGPGSTGAKRIRGQRVFRLNFIQS